MKKEREKEKKRRERKGDRAGGFRGGNRGRTSTRACRRHATCCAERGKEKDGTAIISGKEFEGLGV